MGSGYFVCLPMWNLVCLKLHSKGKSLPTIHNFEIIGDSFLASFTTWGKLCHSATDTVSIEQHEIYVYNIYRITWYIHEHQLYGLLIGVTFPLRFLHLLAVSPLFSLTSFSPWKCIWQWQRTEFIRTNSILTKPIHSWITGLTGKKVNLFPSPRESYLFFPCF